MHNLTIKIKFDIELMKFISLFEKITKINAKDCFKSGAKLVFIVNPGYIGKAIGKGGVNIKKLESLFKKKIKIAIDASNGTAGKMGPLDGSKSPTEIIPINFEHSGKFKHAPNPLVEKYLSEVKAAVKEQQCDCGVCFDGEAGRLVMMDICRFAEGTLRYGC